MRCIQLLILEAIATIRNSYSLLILFLGTENPEQISVEGMISVGKNFTEVIENGCHEAIIDESKMQVFPLMHSGFWGTRARPIDQQKKDWELVKAWLDKIHDEVKNYG